MSDMTYDEAQDIVAHVAAERIRWGKQYLAHDVGRGKILDALVALAAGSADDFAEGDLRRSLATANRQAGAAKAREAKAQNTIKELRAELAEYIVTVPVFPLQYPTSQGDDSEGV
jgi:hypothetical protein